MNKIYIFDLDGTLIDSMAPAVKIVLDFLDEYGIVYPADIVKTLTPLGFRGISVYYAEKMGVPLPPEEIYRIFEERLVKAYEFDIPLKEGVKETLTRLKEQGARLNVLTASPHTFTDVCLKRRGVYPLFENVWAAEDFGCMKSDGRIYAKAAERLGVSVSACIMADDSLRVLKTAKAAGMRTLGVYDEMSADNEKEIREIADGYVYRLTELL